MADVGYRGTGFKSDNVQPTFGYMQQRRISDSRDGNACTADSFTPANNNQPVISERDHNFCLISERIAASWFD